jgi:hypothetical protein
MASVANELPAHEIPRPMTLFTIQEDGTGLRSLTHHDANNWSPFPAPAGHRCVFVKVLRPHVYQTYFGDIDSDQQIRLTFSEAFDGHPPISPDGHWLAFHLDPRRTPWIACDCLVLAGHFEPAHRTAIGHAPEPSAQCPGGARWCPLR